MNKQRHIVKMALTDDAKNVVNERCNRYGMTQIELVSRVFDWFSRQPERVQLAMLNLTTSDAFANRHEVKTLRESVHFEQDVNSK